jgi:hypothetical protein
MVGGVNCIRLLKAAPVTLEFPDYLSEKKTVSLTISYSSNSGEFI